jgi:putative nucleotidyltransferase with HDIG domain
MKLPDNYQDLIKSMPADLKGLLFKQWDAKQNPNFHPEGNTLKHIIYVLRRAYKNFSDEPNVILAALFHDLGKMDTYEISPKTGLPTAHGHEKVSAKIVEDYADWINSFEDADADEVKYLVKNHMLMKPQTWDAMREKRKKEVTDDPAFQRLEKFATIDKGGIAESKHFSPSNEITLSKRPVIENLIEYCNSMQEQGEVLTEAEYKGRKVSLNKPMKGDVKKYKVYVKNPKTGKIIKVNFGDKNMEIKRDDPKRRKNFRARHKCDTRKDKTTASYWSCKFWSTKPVSDLL